MRGTIRRVFLNVSMVNRIDGLRAIAEKEGVKCKELDPWSYLIFVNAARDKIAILVGSHDDKKDSRQIMAYKKLEPGRKLDMTVIKHIPRYFNGQSLNYDNALFTAVTEALAKREKNAKILSV